MDIAPEQLIQEQLRRNELAFNQAKNQEAHSAQEAVDTLRKIKRPSRFAYFFLISASVIADLFDIVEAVFLITTGASSELISFWVALVISIVFIIIGLFEGGKVTRAGKASDHLNQRIEHINQRITNYRRIYAGALRAGRKIPLLRKPVRTFALSMRKITGKSRVLRNSLLQLIPLIDLWPWQTIATWQTYKARKQTYENAQEEIRLHRQMVEEERSEFQQLQEALAEDPSQN